MESQPQNYELRNNPETFHPCIILVSHSRMPLYYNELLLQERTFITKMKFYH